MTVPTDAICTHGKFVWFEHMSPDVDKAHAFYEALFGWQTSTVPMGDQLYPMILNEGQGIGGYRKAAGATVMVEPTDVPQVGRFCVVIDPFGAPISLIKAAP